MRSKAPLLTLFLMFFPDGSLGASQTNCDGLNGPESKIRLGTKRASVRKLWNTGDKASGGVELREIS
jgi:hypothetical protein